MQVLSVSWCHSEDPFDVAGFVLVDWPDRNSCLEASAMETD